MLSVMRRTAAAALLGTALVAGLIALAWTRAPCPPARITISIVGTNDLHGAHHARSVGPRRADRVRRLRREPARGARAPTAARCCCWTRATRSRPPRPRCAIWSRTSPRAAWWWTPTTRWATPRWPSATTTSSSAAGATPAPTPADLRGALKAAAARARFPFLTANILDAGTGKPLAWPNVRPSTIVDAAGIRVGLIGVMTFDGLTRTLLANVGGLTTAPLVPAIAAEAASLRRQGADIVVLVAHAGGRCEDTSDARDLSTCDQRSEIFDVVRGLPRGTLQAIVAGHTHGSMAHVFEGVPITSVPEGGIQFGRMDLTIDTATRRVAGLRVYPPRNICTRENPATGDCQAAGNGVPVGTRARPCARARAVASAMAPALAEVRRLRGEPLGVTVAAPIERVGAPESPLGNLFADAIRASTPAPMWPSATAAGAADCAPPCRRGR